MAFVNELISEVDREAFYSFKFKNGVTRKSIQAWRWTIDRERDIFLVSLGGQGFERSEIPEFFALVWRNNVIRMEAFNKECGDIQSGVEIWWRITRIEIPEILRSEQEIIIELIKEVFDAYGSSHKRNIVKRINFDMIATPIFV